MKNLSIIIVFISFTLAGYCQKNDDTKSYNYYDYIKSVKSNWTFFALKDTINAKVLFHLPAGAVCGFFSQTSMTIVKTNNDDVIRILDFCNVDDSYRADQIIKVIPGVYGDGKTVLPFAFETNKITKEVQSISAQYDLAVLKTAWGKLLK